VTKLGVLLGALLLVSTSRTTGADPTLPRGQRLLEKKDVSALPGPGATEVGAELPTAATLVQTHTGEHVILDADGPDAARFSAMLADRVTGQTETLEPRLLGLLRALSTRHPGARIELVSGYRSKKLNEMMRKKGHHVASHSQHSLGHAVDFRVVLPEHARAEDPRAIERELRAMGWDGGIGVYPTADDWFVHADVGPRRAWTN
jgi:uncharacterized protein YcbK (DUF882 family)